MKKIVVTAVLAILVSCGIRPERIGPDPRIHWNPANPMTLRWPYPVRTNGITALVGDTNNPVVLDVKSVLSSATDSTVEFTLPTNASLADGIYPLLVTNSTWTRLLSNNVVVVDSVPPSVKILAASPVIVRGGSALVVFRASDEHLISVRLQEKTEGNFPVQNYGAIDEYAALVAWPVYRNGFTPEITAKDQAGNRTVLPLNIPAENRRYPVSRLTVDTKFAWDKLEELGTSLSNIPTNAVDRYQMAVQGMAGRRQINLIDETFRPLPGEANVTGLRLPFDPVPSARITSPYGEHRYFYLGRKAVRDSYHLGLDMARSTNADILASNDGTVVFAGYNGAYGNMLLIHHGLGLYTVYGHCSVLLVAKNNRVRAGQVVARTGKTGYALGDHLHFSVIIQGRYANPREWMDPEWVRVSILDVFRRAGRAGK